MRIQTMSHSSYPRVGDSVRLQGLRRTHEQWERGIKSVEDLRASQDLAVLEAIMEQDKTGLDLATEGQWLAAISQPPLLPKSAYNKGLFYISRAMRKALGFSS